MRYAFVVDTPYQLMSALSFATNHTAADADRDLYIDTKRCVNADMDGLLVRAKETAIFDNVYTLVSLSSGKKGKQKTIGNLTEWLVPHIALKIGAEKRKVLSGKDYDVVVVSGPFMLQRNFISLFPKARLVFIEDGSGSYNGRIGVNGLSKKGELLQKILRRGPAFVNPYECYVYSPDFYDGEYADRIRKLSIASSDVLRTVFNTESDEYTGKKIVYLDQPRYMGEEDSNTDFEILELLKGKKDVVARPHPQLMDREYEGISVDKDGTQWELICSRYIDKDSILIGKYSTAQLTPKLIFDIEPVVVFTHRLYRNAINDSLDKAVERFKKVYRNKKRIIVPLSLDELRDLLSD